MAAITSTFVGNHAITWEPGTPAPQQTPVNVQKEDFDTFLKAELEKCKNKTVEYHGKSALWRANRTKHMLALRAVLHDPSSSLAIPTNDMDFDGRFVRNLAVIRTLMATWSNKPPEDVRQDDTEAKASRNAEKIVPSWYGSQCSLTGVQVFDASHVIDLQAVKGIGEDSLNVWRYLRVFWPLKKLYTFDIFGKELENILPLAPTARRLWDTHKLGLRPIPHPHNPNNSIYLQVVWFRNYHNEIGWSSSGSASNAEDLVDTRREIVDSATQQSGCEFIAHGDVYEFKTTSATTRPLPNLRFLQLRYAVQKLFAGVQAAGALEQICEGESPNDTKGPSRGLSALEQIFAVGTPEETEGPDPPDDSYMPRDWDMMLDEALWRGILDKSSETLWRKCILKRAYHEYCEAMARRQALMDEMGPDSGMEED